MEEFGRILYQRIIREPSSIEDYAKANDDCLRSYRNRMFRLLIAREVSCFKVDGCRDLYKAAVMGSNLIRTGAKDWGFICRFNHKYANFCDSSYCFVEEIVTKGIGKSWFSLICLADILMRFELNGIDKKLV
jgi:hypothetical protein